jgi:hypothetical protein
VNIAFLIKHIAGPDVAPSCVSIPIIRVRDVSNGKEHNKVSVWVHNGPGSSTFVVSAKVGLREDVVLELTEKVNEIIGRMLIDEENGGAKKKDVDGLDRLAL